MPLSEPYQNIIKTLLNLTVYRITVIKNMRTKVDRVINITETVQTEVDFPKYTRDLFFYYKHYSFNNCVSISIINSFASVIVTHNNNGKNLFDEEITEDVFNRVMERVSELLMPELQQKQGETI